MQGDGRTLDVDGQEFDICAVSMGNPHAVLQVDDPDTAPVATLGANELPTVSVSWEGVTRERGFDGIVEAVPYREGGHLERFFDATRQGMLPTLRYQAEARRHDLLWRPRRVTERLREILLEERPDVVLSDQISFGATVALLSGMEGLIGAFLAGLGLNRLVPAKGSLMERLEFVGSSLFVPAFLVSIGLSIDPSVLFDLDTVLLGGLFTALVLVGKVEKLLPPVFGHRQCLTGGRRQAAGRMLSGTTSSTQIGR